MKKYLIVGANVLVGLVTIIGLSGFNSVHAATQTLVPLDSAGDQGNGQTCGNPAVSSDGRYIAIPSTSTNLVSSDTNGLCDVFLRDTKAGTTTLESVSTSGVQANKAVNQFAMSRNGRYMAFSTWASNLADGTTTSGDWPSVYLRDTKNNTTQLVAGSYYHGDSNYAGYENAVVSDDGRFVYYYAIGAPASVEGFYVRDMLLGTTSRVDAAADGTAANALSSTGIIGTDCSGRFAAFQSPATNLVTDGSSGGFLVDLAGPAHVVKRVLADSGSLITCDGDHIVFGSSNPSLVPDDTNGIADVFEYDVANDAITRISTDASGDQIPTDCVDSNPGCVSGGIAESMDGQYVAMRYFKDITVGGQQEFFSYWIENVSTGTLTEVTPSDESVTASSIAITGDARQAYYIYQPSGSTSKLYMAADYLE